MGGSPGHARQGILDKEKADSWTNVLALSGMGSPGPIWKGKKFLESDSAMTTLQ